MFSSNAIVNLHQKSHDKFNKFGGISLAYPVVIMFNTFFFILAFESAQLFIKLSNTRNIDLLKFASLDQRELIALALITMVALCTIGFLVNKFIPKDDKEALVAELAKLKLTDDVAIIKAKDKSISDEDESKIKAVLEETGSEDKIEKIRKILAKEEGKTLLSVNLIAWVPGLLNEVAVKCYSGKTVAAA